MQSSMRFYAFFGKVPRPTHEPDYDSWRSSIELAMTNNAMSDLKQSRRILESLFSPAADVFRHFNPTSLPAAFLQLLDSAYGTVQDGNELFAKFLDTFQDACEKLSAYLQCLQVALNLAVKRGGVSSEEVHKHLLAQFCRGCWNDSLLTELQLKQNKTHPPPSAEL